ncbi:MAG TPA: type IV toxin-antitoxin system AbiEi family antitoxin [Hymenobacter sp.]|jgi:hypothetical protein
MNTPEQQRLLRLASQALENQLQQPVHLHEGDGEAVGKVTHIPHQTDSWLRIGNQTQALLLEAKPKLGKDTVAQLRHLNEAGGLAVALVAPYIPDALGRVLQRMGIQYLDTAGNTYLQHPAAGGLILIRGQRQPTMGKQVQHRAFQPAGVQLLYQLLRDPQLLQAPYRVLADQAQVALGSVSVLLRSLQQLELLRDEAGKRRWTDPAQVLHRWVAAYGEVVRPRLHGQRYRWLEAKQARQGWQQLELGPDMAWGGEPAAHLLLEGYLLPEYFTLYTAAPRGEIMRRLRLVPDEAGKVEVLPPMSTTLGPERPLPRAVHPLLAYADLYLTAEPRNREVAHLLHERYLSHLA